MTEAISYKRILMVLTSRPWYSQTRNGLNGIPMKFERFRARMRAAELISSPYNAKSWWEDMIEEGYLVRVNQDEEFYTLRLKKVADLLEIELPSITPAMTEEEYKILEAKPYV